MSSSSSNGDDVQTMAAETLTELSFDRIQTWFKSIRTAVMRNGRFAEVAESINGIGPRELHGIDEEGLAYGRGKHPTIKTKVTNREMGEVKIREWMSVHKKSREEALAAEIKLTKGYAAAKVIGQLRSVGRSLVGFICSCIEDELLLRLEEDEEFAKSRNGTCVVSLMEAIQDRAANATQSSRIDKVEAERTFRGYRMVDDKYLLFKRQTKANHLNAQRAGSTMSDEEAVGTIVSNLNTVVFPTIYKEFLKKEAPWTLVVDLAAMWRIIDAEYRIFTAMRIGIEESTKKTHPGLVSKPVEEVGHVAYMAQMTQEQFDSAVKQGVQEQLKRKSYEVGIGDTKRLKSTEIEGQPQRFCHRFAKFGFCKFKDGCSFVHCNDRAVLAKAGYEAPPEEYFNNLKKRGNHEPVMTMLSSVVESMQRVAETLKGVTMPAAPSTAKKNPKATETHPLAKGSMVHFTDDSVTETAFLAAMEAASKSAAAFKMDLSKDEH